MVTISVRLNSEEQELFNQYAILYGLPVSTLMKKALEEKIEDELDLASIKDYENRLASGSIETFDHKEVQKMLGL